MLNFNHLYEQIKHDTIDEGRLSEIERRHNLFPDIDYRIYARCPDGARLAISA